MNCPNCQTSVVPGAAFCDNCGASLSPMPQAAAPPPPSYAPPPPAGGGNACPNCSQPVMPGEAFCGNCGASIAAPLPPTQAGGAPPAYGAPPPPPQQQQYAPPPPPPAGGGSCNSCGAQLQPNSQFCDNCGAGVSAGVPQPPQQQQYAPPPQQQQQQYAPPPPPQQQQQYAPPPQQQQQYAPPPMVTPRLTVQASGAPLNVPAGKNVLLIGREDPVSNHYPDIDLTPHGGDEGGVGRRHATLHIQGNQVMLEDSQSVNGTYVNRQKLQNNERRPLNSGDELRFGKVVVTYQAS